MIEIIPAIDIIDGRCVRLTQGDYGQKKVYDLSVADAAKSYEDAGIRRLHMVDLDGAKASYPKNLKVLEQVASSTGLDIEYGGGIKGEGALRDVFSAGADRAICGSIAVGEPEKFREWLVSFGSQRIILGADIKDGKIATHGWLEESALDVCTLIDMFASSGLSQVICTDISRDGMLQGPATELYTGLQSRYPQVDVIVSGGVSCMEDIERLSDAGLRYVIAGKAIYEGRITVQMLEQWSRRG